MNHVHETALVDKKVKLGNEVYIAAYAVLNANEGEIIIGDKTNIQEHVVMHGRRVDVGSNCTIGHGAVLHGCKIGNNVLIGINAVVLDGAEIGDWSIIGAGAVVSPGKKIDAGSLAVGVPAKILRELTDEDKEFIGCACRNYLEKQEK